MKYVNFTKYPLFMPMYNPVEMLQMGVFGGTAFKYATGLREKFPKVPWNGVTHGVLWNAELNYYQCAGEHIVHEFKQPGKYFNPLQWFEWYTEFYFNHNKGPRDNDQDYYFISHWAHYISLLYRERATEIVKRQPHIMQALLEVGYDGKHQPNFNTTWMRTKLPLKMYNPAT